jgi:hypothetical protein
MGVVLVNTEKKLDEFGVWPENWDTVTMFLRLQTQWNVTMGGYIGLRYEMLPWLCDLYSVEDPKSLLEGLQIMEAAALKVLNDNG